MYELYRNPFRGVVLRGSTKRASTEIKKSIPAFVVVYMNEDKYDGENDFWNHEWSEIPFVGIRISHLKEKYRDAQDNEREEYA